MLASSLTGTSKLDGEIKGGGEPHRQDIAPRETRLHRPENVPLTAKVLIEFWRPVRESNPCRRESEATYCNSMELRGMDSTLPHFKDSQVLLLDS